ncbi:MAG TPA: hypothetical protein VE078_15100 [Thermoanaerobaculia bacterium]|nr:hypothetical protein [Thermoanaerobaculia bacterium]
MPATAQAAKPKARKRSADPASAQSALEIEEQLRAFIKAKLAGNPRLRWVEHNLKIGRETVEEFLKRKRSFRLDHLEIFAKLFGTTAALLLAEARGNGAMLAKVALHEQLIPTLKLMQNKVEEWRSGIVPSPREDAMLEGDEEQDEATEMRALLECISRQHLADTIAAAQQMVDWRPMGKNSKEEE